MISHTATLTKVKSVLITNMFNRKIKKNVANFFILFLLVAFERKQNGISNQLKISVCIKPDKYNGRKSMVQIVANIIIVVMRKSL